MISKVFNITAGFLFALGVMGVATAKAHEPQATSKDSVPGAEQSEPKLEVDTPASPEQITDRTHPNYVRCRTERVMGSLAQRRKRCMTNREWAALANEGNKRANEFVDEMRSTGVRNN